MITIKEFTNQIDAAMLQSFLKDNEIEAVLLDEYAASWVRGPLAVPIRVQVPDQQAVQAIALLQQIENSPPPLPPEADPA